MNALIFDFDGLIVDTETAIFRAWEEIYAAHDQVLRLEDYVRCVGSDFDTYSPKDALDALVGSRIDWPTLEAKKDLQIRENLAAQDTRPGVRELIREAHAANLPLAVASSSSRNWVCGWLEKLDLDGFFQAVRCRDDVRRIKPEPDLFLAAASALGVPPAGSMVLEDSENGLRAATAAGSPCTIIHNAVTRGGNFDQAVGVHPGFERLTLSELLCQARGISP